jgi:hypothetical protein
MTKILFSGKKCNLKEIGSELEIFKKLKSPYLIEMIETFEFHEQLQLQIATTYSCIVIPFCDVNKIKSYYKITILIINYFISI